ncbi:unnamed protein product [Prunus brigantina]
MGKKSKSKTPREMQDNTAAVEEEKPSSSAKKLLNHWNTWRAMRVILKDVIAVGIGGSFLGPLQTDPKAIETARGRQLHL